MNAFTAMPSPVSASCDTPVTFKGRARQYLLTTLRTASMVGALGAVGTVLALTCTTAFAQAPAAVTPPPTIKQFGQFPEIELSAGLNVIHAEVAANDADREQGLMYRKSLRPNSGMLFVFDDTAGHCFWMKNTEIPLSIAFIADDGTVTDIEEMAAETENNHCPTRAIRYALEMDKGWFAQHGVTPGMQIKRMGAGQ